MTATPTTVDLSGLPPPVAASVRQLVDTLRAAGGAASAVDTTPQAPPVRKTLRGRFAHLGLSIPPEHIAEAQRECWAAFPPGDDS